MNNEGNNLFNVYNKLFDVFLRVSKSKYNSEKPYENLEECITTCEHCSWKLFGMLSLMEEAKEISFEKAEEERHRVSETFSSCNLFNAYMTNGEIMVFEKRSAI